MRGLGEKMKWYIEFWKNFGNFEGRTRRSGFWYPWLINFMLGIFLTVIDTMIGTYDSNLEMGILGLIFTIFIIVPSISVMIRRLHDTGRSGWWSLLSLIPLGNIVVIVFLALDSEPETNKYGDNPKTSNL
mgnify:CR=1 FL=1